MSSWGQLADGRPSSLKLMILKEIATIGDHLLSVYSYCTSSLRTFPDGLALMGCIGLCRWVARRFYVMQKFWLHQLCVSFNKSGLPESCLCPAVLLDDLGGSKSD